MVSPARICAVLSGDRTKADAEKIRVIEVVATAVAGRVVSGADVLR